MNSIANHRLLGFVILAISLGSSQIARSDWPQLLGPKRDGHAKDGEMLPKMLAGAIRPAWEIDCGQGYAGVAVSDSKVALFDRVGEQERVRLLDAATGQPIWERLLQSEYRTGFDSDLGPRCVPTMFEGGLLTYGASGQLSRLDLSDGTIRWSRALRKEYSAPAGYFGAGSSPLLVGEMVIVNVGGKKEGGIVGIHLETGENRWMATNEEASYASPIELIGESESAEAIALVPTRLKAIGIGSQSGKLFFEFPFGKKGTTVNAATPLQLPDRSVFLTASYGIGASLIRPTEHGVESDYRDVEDLVSSQYCTPVAIDGLIYASDGREDGGDAFLKCIDGQAQKVLWKTALPQVSHLLVVGDQLLVMSVDGTLRVYAANPKRPELLSEGQLPKGRYRALPAFSQGTLFLRSGDHYGPRKLYAIR